MEINNTKHIGIMSMHRIINYGSYLQAYGLKYVVENESGCVPEFIDYPFEKDITVQYKSFKSRLFAKIKKNINVLNFIKIKKYYINEREALIEDLKQIDIDKHNFNKELDILIIGSDEVFNCLQPYPVGYSKALFGKDYDNCAVISYAASFGHTKYEDLIKYGIADEIGSMLSKFKSISVRDDNSYSIVKALTGREAIIHLDPVLIYDFKSEMKEYVTHECDYIIVYAYTGRLSFEEEKYIKKFAKKINKKIISIGNYIRIADKNIICNPLYIFSYFKNADYIITDTFHGSIFSIKTNSKFCTIIRDSNRNKLSALLSKLERTDRMVNKLEDIERLYAVPIDYAITNSVIEEEKKRTVEYIKGNYENVRVSK